MSQTVSPYFPPRKWVQNECNWQGKYEDANVEEDRRKSSKDSEAGGTEVDQSKNEARREHLRGESAEVFEQQSYHKSDAES